jgi:hypothetical protein
MRWSDGLINLSPLRMEFELDPHLGDRSTNQLMKSVNILLLILILASCAPKTISTTTDSNGESGGTQTALRDGTSIEKAVIAKDIPSEYQWVREHYPGSRVLSQALLNKGRKPYDMLEVQMANGQKTKVYFDISSFFGKW